MESFLKSALHRYLPKFTGAITAGRDRQRMRRFERDMEFSRIRRAFTKHHGLTVLGGPFAGMSYVSNAVGSAYVPKLLGSYEMELHPIVEALVQKGCDKVIDIGCAEGYYAVGLARRMVGAEVFAFDTASEGRKLCAAMAEANGVAERVAVAGTCDPAQLNALLAEGDALVICDCEGCEYTLLRLEAVPNLRRAHLLVELHPWTDPSSPSFLPGFAATHDLQMVHCVPRRPQDFPALAFLPPKLQQRAVNEWRGTEQEWVFLSPRIKAV